MNRIIITLCLGMSLAACSQSSEETPAKPPTEAAAKTKPAPLKDDAEIPVAADFEEEVRAEITAENYAAELDKLEAELSD